MTTSRSLQLVLAGILATGAIACGGGADAQTAPADSGGAAAPADDAAASDSTTVEIDDLAYEPATVEVATGSTVTWRNAEDVPHTVTFSSDDVESSDKLNEGDEFSTTFDAAGTFDYICAIHPEMKGSVTVQ